MRSLLCGFTFSLLLFFAAVAGAAESETIFGRAGGLELLGDGPHRLHLAAGDFDTQNSAAAQLELRGGQKLWFVGPLAGVMANTGGGVMGYLGIYADLAAGPLVFTGQTGFGAYENGDSKDLGGTLEFISSLTAAWRFSGGDRLGVRYEHISNADVYYDNPGANLLLLEYAFAF